MLLGRQCSNHAVLLFRAMFQEVYEDSEKKDKSEQS